MPSWKYITPSNGLIQKQAKRWNGDGAEVSQMKPPTLTKANKLAVFSQKEKVMWSYFVPFRWLLGHFILPQVYAPQTVRTSYCTLAVN